MQLTIEHAIEAGNRAAQACTDKAEHQQPEFRELASAAILRHLEAVREASGEDLTDIALAHGAKPHDLRAFGAVFQALARKGLIRTVGYCARKRGHGTAGGRVWAIAESKTPH